MYKGISRIVLLVITLLTTLALTQFPSLRFSYDFESFFPTNDDDLVFYNQFREEFAPDNDFVLMAFENKAGIFDTSFLQKVDRLTGELLAIEYVKSVDSPTRMKEFRMGPLGPISFDMLHINNEEKLRKDSLRIYKDKIWVERFFADDANSMLVYLTTDPGLSKAKSDTVVKHIDKVLAQYEFDNLYKSGRVYGQKYYVAKMQQELAIFVVISVILLVIFLAIAFRSVWGVVVPMMVVFLTVIWQLGIMAAIDQPLDVLSMLLPTILFVVGISDVVHIINRYLEELRLGKEKSEAVLIAFKQVGIATFLTSLTTAIGFMTLVSADIMPIKDFGWQTAMGVWLAFILAFTFLPSILILLPQPKLLKDAGKSNFWTAIMTSAYRIVLQRTKTIVGIGVVFCVLSLVGISLLKVDNYLLEDLAEDDPYMVQFRYFEDHYSGVRPFEFIVSCADGQEVMKYENLVFLDSIEQAIYANYPVTIVESPLFIIKYMNQMMHSGDRSFYRIPATQKEWRKIRKIMKSGRVRNQLSNYTNEEGTMFRFSCRIKDIGGHEMNKRNTVFLTQVEEVKNYTANELEGRMTGMSLLIDKNNATLAKGMMEGLLVAFAVIALLMGWLFRSLPMVLITLVPNVLPLIGIAGVMGFSGIDLKVSTSIIFTIAFGIAVDDTIHYVSKLRVLLKSGRSLPYAMKRTGISTGKAIVVTSIILISGFISLIFSSFASTFYIGLLVSITLLLAVLFDLFLLPALIIVFYRKRK